MSTSVRETLFWSNIVSITVNERETLLHYLQIRWVDCLKFKGTFYTKYKHKYQHKYRLPSH